MLYYIAKNKDTDDFVIVDEGHQDELPLGFNLLYWPPFKSDMPGEEVMYAGMEHIKTCERLRLSVISMN